MLRRLSGEVGKNMSLLFFFSELWGQVEDSIPTPHGSGSIPITLSLMLAINNWIKKSHRLRTYINCPLLLKQFIESTFLLLRNFFHQTTS
jgi:hypothetical protein